ncbi:MAG: tetratricopeptide repeat protein [Alistipes sp.]|nr:tetratricopeptide repeat protein [Alistipes sp.]
MRRYYCLILLIAAMISSCASNSNIIENLDRAAEIMNEKPDSAKIVLDGIRRSELKNRALKARFALLYSQAMDKCYIDTDNDSLISVALKYYSKHGTDHEKALAYYYESVVHCNAKNIEAQIKAMLVAQKYIEKTDDEYIRGLIYHRLANNYYLQMQYKEALPLYEKSLDIFGRLNNKTNLLLAYEGCVSCLNLTDRGSEAVELRKKALQLAEEIEYIERIIPLKIDTYRHSESKDPQLLKSIKHDLTKYKERLDVEQYRYWGITYDNEHKIDSALYFYKYYIQQIKEHTHASLGAILIISRLAESKGYLNTTIEYERLYSDISGKFYAKERKVLIQSLEQKHKTQQAEAAYKKLQERYRMTTIIYALLGVIAAISAAWAISRHKRRNAQRLAEYQEYIEQADLQRNKLQEKFHNIQQQIEQQNLIKDEQRTRLLEVLKNRIESLRQLSELASVYGVGDNSRFYGKFQEHIQLSKNKNQELMNDIIEVADLLHNGVISFLRENNSSLTKHELCYCGFIALGFSPESIRVLYNHTNINSIYTTRGKIRNKLSLNAAYRDLEAYILELSEKLGEKKDAQQG